MLKKLFLSLVLVFVSRDFYTLSEAISFMNTLPQEAQPYVIALNSARSGMMNGYYSVVYKH